MAEEGKYLYCIIAGNEGKGFGPIGIGGTGDEVTTVAYDGLSSVVSNATMKKYAATRENTIAHEKAIEEVMRQGFTALPVRFSTVADSSDDILALLKKRSQEFKDLLHQMDNKIELGIKALWLDMPALFSELVAEREDIRLLKSKAVRQPSRDNLIRVGEMVQKALPQKKEAAAALVLDAVKGIYCDVRLNKPFGDRMFLNAAFLVDRDREGEFDDRIVALRSQYSQKMKIAYVGPVPPFNFVNIVIHWEEIKGG